MSKTNNNENLVNNSNLSQKEQKMILQIDGLLVQRLSDLIESELEWLCENYIDDELAEFLEGENYYSNSPLINGMNRLIEELLTDKKFRKVFNSLE